MIYSLGLGAWDLIGISPISASASGVPLGKALSGGHWSLGFNL